MDYYQKSSRRRPRKKVVQVIQGVKQHPPYQSSEQLYAQGYVKVGGNKYGILKIEVSKQDSNWLYVYASETPVDEKSEDIGDDFYFNPMDWNEWQELRSAI